MLIARVIIALGPTSVLAEFIWVREVSYRRALGIGVRHSPHLKVSIQPHALAFVTTRLLVNAVLGSHVVLTQGLSVAGLTFCPALTAVVAGHGPSLLPCASVVCCHRSLGPSVWKLHNLQPSLKKSFWCTDSMCTFSASAVSTSLGQKAHLQKQLESSN
jgi:hypothetical protein